MRENDRAILIADRCTPQEADRYIKHNAYTIYSPNEYKDLEAEYNVDIDEVRKGHIPDMSCTNYNGSEYIVVYQN